MISISQKIILILCFIMLLLLAGLVVLEKYSFRQPMSVQGVKITPSTTIAINQNFIDSYKDINLEAKSAIVYDLSDQKIMYQLSPYTSRPLASITKIATALVGKTILPQTEQIKITSALRSYSTDSVLKSGDTWLMRDLAQYFLVSSSNDGAQILCSYIDSILKTSNPKAGDCVSLLNRYALNQGLLSMHFVNPTGLDNSDNSASNYGSAYDVARLMALAYSSYPDLFSITSQPTASFKIKDSIYTAINTDKIIDKIPELLVSKTGYTETAGGNLAIIYSPAPNKKIVIVILGSSQEGRFSDMLTLVNHTNTFFHYTDLYVPSKKFN